MNKLSSQKLISSQTIGHSPQQEITHFTSYNRYKNQLTNKSEAIKRIKVLTRQLQKSKSQLRNKKRHDEEKKSIQQMADIDKFILRLNSVEQQRSLKKLRDNNIKKRTKRLSHLEEVKSQLQNTHTEAYHSTERKKIQNERTIILEHEKQQNFKEIKAMREKIKEKQRAHKVIEFYQEKMERIKKSKEKEKRTFMVQQLKQSAKIDLILKKNAKLRLKKERSLKSGFLYENFLDLSAQQVNNPQKTRRVPPVRLIKEIMHP